MNIYAFVYTWYSPELEEEGMEQGYIAASSVTQATAEIIERCGVNEFISLHIEIANDNDNGIILFTGANNFLEPLSMAIERNEYIKKHLMTE